MMANLIDTFTLALEQHYFELRWGAHLYMDFFSRVNATVLHKPWTSVGNPDTVQLSLSVVSDSLQSHGLQHTRLPCPSPTHRDTQTHVHWISDATQPSHPLYHPLLLLPSIFPSIRDFSKESVLRIRWPKYWSFSFNITPSNEHPGLISFRIDWFDLLAVQGTLKSLLLQYSSKVSILQCSAFFIVQLSHPYMTLEKP